jgi:DNA-binding NarL/FixJ family response regulator
VARVTASEGLNPTDAPSGIGPGGMSRGATSTGGVGNRKRTAGWGRDFEDDSTTGAGWQAVAEAVAEAALADDVDPFMTDQRAVRVLLVDDDALVRSGLSMMLGAFDEIEVVGAASDGSEVVAAVRKHRPDVVLMDIRMPGIDGLTATATLRKMRDAPEVIVLTTFDTDEHVTRALRSGASGFLLKHTPPAEIARAICRVAAGEPMMSPEVLRKLMGLAAVAGVNPERDRARERLTVLSRTEREVALLVAKGRPNQDIATELLMSTATVKAHVSRIFTKLDVANRVEIAVLVHDAR